MRALVAAVRPDLLDAACELVGEDSFPRVEESTRFAQPAILCAISPVHWRDTMTTLDSLGVEQYVDVGPGGVLSKLAARCIRGASAATAHTLLEDISAPV